MLTITNTEQNLNTNRIGNIRASYNKLVNIFGDPIYDSDIYKQSPRVKWDLVIEFDGSPTGTITVSSEVVNESDATQVNEWNVTGASKFNLYDLEEYISNRTAEDLTLV